MTLSTGTAQASAHWDRMYETATRSAWTQNSQVAEAIYIRMTDQPGFWLEWLFTQGTPPVDRLLSIGCGDGGHELAVARRGFAQHVTAFDASPVAIELASAQASRESLSVDFQVRLFEQFIEDPGVEESFDAVLFSGSLHHVTDLEGMLSAVRRVLRPSGKVIVNEYVGPCYQLYPKGQVDVVNRVLEDIPLVFRMGSEDRLMLPSMDAIIANDPTEGVRSALIPTLLPLYFREVYRREVGGALLHPLFGYLNGAKINDGSPESRMLVQMLISLERELTSGKILSNDFMFGIYQKD